MSVNEDAGPSASWEARGRNDFGTKDDEALASAKTAAKVEHDTLHPSTPEKHKEPEPAAEAEPGAAAEGAAPLKKDLPFDNDPIEGSFVNREGLRIQTYLWPASRVGVEARGRVAVCHGVRSHARLTWLVKRGRALDRAAKYNIYSPDPISKADPLPHSVTLSHTHTLAHSDTDTHTHPRCHAGMTSPPRARATSPPGVSYPNDVPLDLLEDEVRDTNVFYEGSWVHGFNLRGIDVYGMDLQGHGKSEGWEGRRCTARSYESWVDDTIDFLNLAGGAGGGGGGGLPLYAIGVSLTGHVLLRALTRPDCPKLEAAILIAGLFSMHPQMERMPLSLLLAVNRRVARFRPHFGVPLPVRPEWNGPAWQQRAAEFDPYLVRQPFTSHMIDMTVQALTKLKHDAHKVFTQDRQKRRQRQRVLSPSRRRAPIASGGTPDAVRSSVSLDGDISLNGGEGGRRGDTSDEEVYEEVFEESDEIVDSAGERWIFTEEDMRNRRERWMKRNERKRKPRAGRILMLHNFDDYVNPVDSTLEMYQILLQQKPCDYDMKCIIFNAFPREPLAMFLAPPPTTQEPTQPISPTPPPDFSPDSGAPKDERIPAHSHNEEPTIESGSADITTGAFGIFCTPPGCGAVCPKAESELHHYENGTSFELSTDPTYELSDQALDAASPGASAQPTASTEPSTSGSGSALASAPAIDPEDFPKFLMSSGAVTPTLINTLAPTLTPTLTRTPSPTLTPSAPVSAPVPPPLLSKGAHGGGGHGSSPALSDQSRTDRVITGGSVRRAKSVPKEDLAALNRERQKARLRLQKLEISQKYFALENLELNPTKLELGHSLVNDQDHAQIFYIVADFLKLSPTPLAALGPTSFS